jgi:uncharacterized membrane protein YphA (DoxX/SURF4 family)
MQLPSFVLRPQTPLIWLGLLRALVGLLILTTWASNLLKGYYTPDGLQYFFSHVFPQSQNTLSWYAAFINGVILPGREMFAPFQLAAEFLLGLALLLGAFTPLFSLVGIFFLGNVFLATFGHDWPWAYGLPMGVLVVCGLARAGRALGADAWLVRRFGEPPAPYLW